MSDQELDRFLQQASGELESSSEFTLDPTKALAKLGSHQGLAPGLWAVKMVQAAVARGADKVDFLLGRWSLKLSISGGESLSAHEILRLLLAGKIPSQRSDLHLVEPTQTFTT